MSEADRWEQVTDYWHALARSEDPIVRLDFYARSTVGAARYFGLAESSEEVEVAIPDTVRSTEPEARLAWLQYEASGRYQEMVEAGNEENMSGWREAQSRMLDWYIRGLVELELVTSADDEQFSQRYERNAWFFHRFIRVPDAMRSQPNNTENPS
jgi:hypothetical protein